MGVRVKICGTTSLEDALLCAEAGADALGFVFYPLSKRYVTPEGVRRIVSQLPPFVVKVGVFVNESPERVNEVVDFCGLDCVQLHGDETPQECEQIRRPVIKAFRMYSGVVPSFSAYAVSAFLLDAHVPGAVGGTGQVFDWSLVGRVSRERRIVLAGGLTPENVGEAILQVQPYAVDVVTGVEAQPGKKDPEKVRRFLQNVRRREWFLSRERGDTL